LRRVTAPRIAALLSLLTLLAVAACATAGSASPTARTARTYIEAVLHRDGATLCPLLDDTTRRSIDQVVADAKKDPAFRGPADCPHVVAMLIGYPHENMAYRFVSGRLLALGNSRAVTRAGRRYAGVDVRVILRTEENGSYAPMGKSAPRGTFADRVWLTKTPGGWRTAKASLTLLTALNGDILSGTRLEQAYARQALQPPTH
jgi:hypothetical protein